MKRMVTLVSLASLAVVGHAGAQNRFLINDRDKDQVVLIEDFNGDGTIDEQTEVWTFFDAANDAGTIGPSNPTALTVSELGWVLMGDQSSGLIYLLRDLTGDDTAQGVSESIVFADMDNASGISLAFPTGVAFDSTGAMYVVNAGNAFGDDGIYRMADLDGNGTAQGPGEITPYVGEPGFGPGNGPFSPQEIVFDADDVGYLRNAGPESAGLRGVWRFEDTNGNGRADDPGEFVAFWDDTNEAGIPAGVGFAIDLDRANPGSIYTLAIATGGVHQLIRLTDLNGDDAALNKDESMIVWEKGESGFTAVDVISLVNGDVLITDNGSGDGARRVYRLSDLDGDGMFTGDGEETVFMPNEGGTVGNVRQIDRMPRFADVNNDGTVDGGDLALLLGAWGDCPTPGGPCTGDLNGDGVVDGGDLALLLGSWG